MKIILKIHDNIQLVDSSLKDQQVMVVRFSKSVQKKETQNKTKEKKRKKKQQQLKIKRRANKQTNKEKEQLVKRITSLPRKRLEMVLLFQKLVAMTYSILKVVFD